VLAVIQYVLALSAGRIGRRPAELIKLTSASRSRQARVTKGDTTSSVSQLQTSPHSVLLALLQYASGLLGR